jgi:hypothetical protein
MVLQAAADTWHWSDPKSFRQEPDFDALKATGATRLRGCAFSRDLGEGEVGEGEGGV